MALKDVLIAVGVLSFIALFIYGIVKEGRKQKRRQSSFFKKLADRRGWEYLKEDDGTVQRLAQDFEGIGVFSSPSLGKMIPRNVVFGKTKAGRCCIFEHLTRINEGNAMHWTVCLVGAKDNLGRSFVIQSRRKAGTITDQFYAGKKQTIDEDWAKDFKLYCNGEASTQEILPMHALQKIIRELAKLPWRVDMQVRNNRLAVYPSSRNFGLKTVEDLERLIEVSCSAVDYLTENST